MQAVSLKTWFCRTINQSVGIGINLKKGFERLYIFLLGTFVFQVVPFPKNGRNFNRQSYVEKSLHSHWKKAANFYAINVFLQAKAQEAQQF